MFLITTADQRFWRTTEPILFLGEWCKLYERRHLYEKLDTETLPYHWDDRSRLYSDYQYLRGVYERYLDALVPKLNEVHGLDQSARFWRIIVGPWLRYFIEILYDRYLSIAAAADRKCVSDTLISDTTQFQPPSDFPEFNQWFASDSYNHKLYSWLIEKMRCMPFHVVQTEEEPDAIRSRLDIRDVIARLLSRAERLTPGSWHRIALITTQLPRLELNELNKALGQYFPWIAAPPIRVEKPPAIDSRLRHRLVLQVGNSPFERLLDVAISVQMPLAHLEAFQHLQTRALDAYPKNTKTILTSVAETFDEAFKIWTATRVDKGARFFISQHGGLFGSGLWMSTEEHQIKVSDRFYSWGWFDEALPSVKPMPALKLVGVEARIRYSTSGRILWALNSFPRYSYRMLSIPVAGQFLRYAEDQFSLAWALPAQIRRRVLMRLYPESYGWNEELRWRDRCPDIKIYRGRTSMEKQLSQSSLLICGYNTTTFLETLAANFPTIVYWNPRYWELRLDAQPFYTLLEEAGIFHTSHESAASKIKEIHENPLRWWNSLAVQEARKQFCRRFARTSRDWIKEWKSELLSHHSYNDP